jgi:hypothetical protein
VAGAEQGVETGDGDLGGAGEDKSHLQCPAEGGVR